MGINSRGSVSDVETFLEPERSRRRNESACTNNARNSAVKQSQSQTPRTVTESDASDTEIKWAQESTSMDGGSGASESRLQKRKIETIEVSGKEEEEGKEGSSGRSSEGAPSLPQHEQIRPVEPMDINYCATPASIRLKDLLISRLDAAVHTGRIQVVSTIRALGSCSNCHVPLVLIVNVRLRSISRGEGFLIAMPNSSGQRCGATLSWLF
jgi:hypothetical protein